MQVAQDRNKSASEAEVIKQQRLNEMHNLENEENQLLQTINKMHSESQLAQKEYYAAKSLPMRRVADAKLVLEDLLAINSPI